MNTVQSDRTDIRRSVAYVVIVADGALGGTARGPRTRTFGANHSTRANHITVNAGEG